jgi:hypothetical protein
VVVEGSRDGLNWLPLSEGYDARRNARWLDAYNQGLNGNKSLFEKQKFDIASRFEPGDTIFVRFRLFSDQLTAGWGWAIDDLEIQNLVTGLEDEADAGMLLFPNPASNVLNIAYSLPTGNTVRISVTDVLGRQMIQQDLGFRGEGRHVFTIGLEGYRPGIYLVHLDYGGTRNTRRLLRN